MQLFKINYTNNKLLPIVPINEIHTLKIEKLYNYFVINNLVLKEVLFVGHQSNIAKNTIENLNVLKTQYNIQILWQLEILLHDNFKIRLISTKLPLHLINLDLFMLDLHK